ncbi:MAG: NHLP bacteriocin export ABC transporter permease/ATPase subunit, partial [Leptolyngbyaceae cyanobacterium SM1_1_3]|nr:NHLP bacteriocin export ABC transporter permease/ATPase subunit [Leptolyngbyaceae cyanobacterium SM1_1_3]
MTPQTIVTPHYPHTITANEPLLLTDATQVWQLKSGKLAVFAVPMEQGKAVGERRFLFTVAAGEGLFGADVCPDGRGMMAVAVEPSAIAPLLLSETDTTFSTDALKQLIDPWIHHLGQVEGMPKTAQSGT